MVLLASLEHTTMALEKQVLTEGKAQDEGIQSKTETRLLSHLPGSAMLEPQYPPSIASMETLKQIYINDLKPGHHHRGNYLLVRSISLPFSKTSSAGPFIKAAIIAAVEDEKKDSVLLQLCHQPDEEVLPDSSVISLGDVFLIKEPFFMVVPNYQDSKFKHVLRIDHINDGVRIDVYHNLFSKEWTLGCILAANDWRQRGNAEFGKKKYTDAIRSYTTALSNNPSTEEETIIRLNRALAYLQDQSFEAALDDTQCLISTPNTPEKALYRGGKALYGLGRFSECCDIFQSLCDKYPSNSQGPKELERARLRHAEQENGIYDFEAMYKEIAKTKSPQMDHATYVGPVVVKDSPGRGRGLFTTKAVQAGDLLLCEKAFYYGPELHSHFVIALVQKLSRNPSLISEFVTLAHGTYEAVGVTEVDGKPVIDTFLVEQIKDMNIFGCGAVLTSKEALEHHVHGTTASNKTQFFGLWATASRINHSCVSNVRRSFIGDLQIIRATSDIPANTELLFWYTFPSGDLAEIQKELEGYGFECNCAICLDLENAPKETLKMRKDLLQDVYAALEAKSVDTVNTETLLNSLNKTYRDPPTEVPRLELDQLYIKLGGVYAEQGESEKVLEMALLALESLGYVIKGAQLPLVPGENLLIEKWGIMTDETLTVWAFFWSAFSVFAQHQPLLWAQATTYWKTAYKICVGEDVTFLDTYVKDMETK